MREATKTGSVNVLGRDRHQDIHNVIGGLLAVAPIIRMAILFMAAAEIVLNLAEYLVTDMEVR